MSNLTENRLNVVLTAADVTAINTSIATILSKVPANTTLTDEQRLSYNAINVANKVFSDDCLVEAQANGAGILPGYINLANLQNDLTVFNQLDTISSALTNVLQRIEDAKRIAGHEAYVQSTNIYTNFKQAHENGVANATTAFNKLKVRFDAQGNTGKRATDGV